MTKTLVYLATPYSSPDPSLRLKRYHGVNKCAARLMKEGLHIYSPISHSHPIAEAGGLPTDWEWWKEYDRSILNACCKMIVLRLPGWNLSIGVAEEIKIAQELGLPVEYIDC